MMNPSMFSSLSSYTNRADIEAGRLGWELSDLLVDIDNYNSQDVSYYKGYSVSKWSL